MSGIPADEALTLSVSNPASLGALEMPSVVVSFATEDESMNRIDAVVAPGTDAGLMAQSMRCQSKERAGSSSPGTSCCNASRLRAKHSI